MKDRNIIKKIGYMVWILVMAACASGSIFLIKTAINPDDYIIGLRAGSYKNSYDAPKTTTKKWADGYFVMNDIKYRDKNPNSFFDIYSETNDFTKKKPVFIYFHAGAVENNEDAKQANIISNVTGDYPPTYITDGNFSTFNNQAHELDEKLTDLGVKHTSFILDSKEYSNKMIFHSYDITDSDISKQNLENLVRFLKNLK